MNNNFSYLKKNLKNDISGIVNKLKAVSLIPGHRCMKCVTHVPVLKASVEDMRTGVRDRSPLLPKLFATWPKTALPPQVCEREEETQGLPQRHEL